MEWLLRQETGGGGYLRKTAPARRLSQNGQRRAEVIDLPKTLTQLNAAMGSHNNMQLLS